MSEVNTLLQKWRAIGSDPEVLLESRNLHAELADELEVALSVGIPELQMQDLINAGLNAFGLQLFIESIANKKDAKDFKPMSFKFRGIKITFEPQGEIDTRHH